MKTTKKLIEVALPLEAINKAEDRDAQFLEKALRIRDNLFDLSNAQIRYYLKDLVPDYAPQKETEAV